MIEVLPLLTSKTKLEIVNILKEPETPEYIATILKITRQGVDKHLKELLKYGIVERYWLFDSKKPRLEYKLSSLGTYFYTECDQLVNDYRNKGREILNNKLKENDVKLLNNEINIDEYNKNSDNIKREYEWFI